MNRTNIFLNMALLLLVFSSCEVVNDQSYVEQYVVEAYMEAGAQLPELNLSTTAPVDAEFSFEDFAVQGADVTIYEFSADLSDTIQTHQYQAKPQNPGYYQPVVSENVIGGATYHLRIEIDGGNEVITSTTVVPREFESVDSEVDTVVYQLDDFEVDYRIQQYPGRQNYFVPLITALDTTRSLTPFYRDALERDDDGDLTKEDFRESSGGIINEENFEVTQGNVVRVKLPWLAVAFYGPNELQLATIDNNMYDFIRSRNSQFGGSTISPGEIYDVIDHIEGGTGLFGSYAAVRTNFFVRPISFFKR